MNEHKKNQPHKRLHAEPAYENAHLVTLDLLDRIRELLFDLPAPDGEVKIHWGHVGSLNEVNRQLSETIAFLEGCQ